MLLMHYSIQIVLPNICNNYTKFKKSFLFFLFIFLDQFVYFFKFNLVKYYVFNDLSLQLLTFDNKY